MATTVYNRGLDELRDWTSDTIRGLLVTASYTPNKDHDFVSDVSSFELSGTGYARPTLSGKTRTLSDVTDRITYDADDPDFGPIIVGETARYMILYKFVTNDADSILLACYDLGAVATNGADFVVVFDADGALYTDQGA